MFVPIPLRSGTTYQVVADAVTHVEVRDTGTRIWLKGHDSALDAAIDFATLQSLLEQARGFRPLTIKKPIPTNPEEI